MASRHPSIHPDSPTSIHLYVNKQERGGEEQRVRGEGQEIKVGQSNLRQTGQVKFREEKEEKKMGGVQEANPQWAEVMTGDTGEREGGSHLEGMRRRR